MHPELDRDASVTFNGKSGAPDSTRCFRKPPARMAAQEAARRPAAQPKQAFALVQDIWGLKLNPQRIRSLASYDDQNFLFEELPSSEHGQEEPRRQRRFVFKIFSSSITPEVLACQHEVMQRCHDQGVLCGLPILTLAGSGTAKVRLGDAEWACRLMHYCEGKVFAETLHTEELLQTIGEQAALIGVSCVGRFFECIAGVHSTCLLLHRHAG